MNGYRKTTSVLQVFGRPNVIEWGDSCMKRWRCLLLIVTAALVLLPIQAQAQAVTFGQSMAIGYWPAAVSFAGPGGTVTWRTSMLTFDYQVQSPQSPYGFRLQYATGAQEDWSFSGVSGHDTIWSIDVTFAGQFGAEESTAIGRVFVGYGSITWENTDSAGVHLIEATTAFRVGGDLTLPLQSKWSVHVGGVWYPLAKTTITAPVIASEDSASGSAFEYGLSLRFDADPWFVDIGYRGMSVSYGTLSGGAFAGGCPCSTNWTGYVISFGAKF